MGKMNCELVMWALNINLYKLGMTEALDDNIIAILSYHHNDYFLDFGLVTSILPENPQDPGQYIKVAWFHNQADFMRQKNMHWAEFHLKSNKQYVLLESSTGEVHSDIINVNSIEFLSTDLKGISKEQFYENLYKGIVPSYPFFVRGMNVIKGSKRRSYLTTTKLV